MRKQVLIIMLCLCLGLPLTISAEEALPEGISIMSGAALPLNCKPLPDGGFLLSGLCGETAPESIESHLMDNPDGLEETQLAQARPLSGYVAAYDADGTQRWMYRLPETAPYAAVFAQPVEDGLVVCRTMRYQRYGDNYLDWHGTTDAFLLDANGQYVQSLPLLTTLSNEGPNILLEWVHIVPQGILFIEPLTDYDAATYLPTMTLYDWDGERQWQASHESLREYMVLYFEPVADGYIGYAAHRTSEGTSASEPVHTCLFKLDAQGRLAWQQNVFEPELLSGLEISRNDRVWGTGTRLLPHEGDAPSQYVAYVRGYDPQDGRMLWHTDLEEYDIREADGFFEDRNGGLYMVGWQQQGNVPVDGLMRVEDEGVPLDFVRLFGSAGRQTFPDTIMDGPDGPYIVGTMTEDAGKDRWYICPLAALRQNLDGI